VDLPLHSSEVLQTKEKAVFIKSLPRRTKRYLRIESLRRSSLPALGASSPWFCGEGSDDVFIEKCLSNCEGDTLMKRCLQSDEDSEEEQQMSQEEQLQMGIRKRANEQLMVANLKQLARKQRLRYRGGAPCLPPREYNPTSRRGSIASRRGSLAADPSRRGSLAADPGRQGSITADPGRRGSIASDPSRRGSFASDPICGSITSDPSRRGSVCSNTSRRGSIASPTLRRGGAVDSPPASPTTPTSTRSFGQQRLEVCAAAKKFAELYGRTVSIFEEYMTLDPPPRRHSTAFSQPFNRYDSEETVDESPKTLLVAP